MREEGAAEEDVSEAALRRNGGVDGRAAHGEQPQRERNAHAEEIHDERRAEARGNAGLHRQGAGADRDGAVRRT